MKTHIACIAFAVSLMTGPSRADDPTPQHRSVIVSISTQEMAAHSQSQALVQVGKEALKSNRLPSAEAAYREAITFHKEWGPAYYGLAQALVAQGKFPEAIQAYREVIYPNANWISSTGTDTRTMMNYAILLVRTGQWAEAVSIYEKALPDVGGGILPKIDVHFDPQVPQPAELQAAAHIALGLTDNFIGELDNSKALAHYQQALQLEPDWDLANFYYGYGLKRLGRKDEAKDAFAKAAQIGGDTMREAAERETR